MRRCGLSDDKSYFALSRSATTIRSTLSSSSSSPSSAWIVGSSKLPVSEVFGSCREERRQEQIQKDHKCYTQNLLFFITRHYSVSNDSHSNLKATFTSLLRHCSNRTDLASIHHYIIETSNVSSTFLNNLLIDLYGKYGSLKEVMSVFSQMPLKNANSWTCVIEIHERHGHLKKAICLYHDMLTSDVQPDKILYLCVLGVCSKLRDVSCVREIHAAISHLGADSDIAVRTALVNVYGKCGSVENASMVFNLSEERDAILYSTIMMVYNQHGQPEKTFQVYDQMLHEGLELCESVMVAIIGACRICSNLVRCKAFHVSLIHSGYGSHLVAGTALINTYNKCGSLHDAANVFEVIPHGDTILWNTMIGAFVQHGLHNQALCLYAKMQKENFEPSQVTFVCSLGCIAEPCALPQGRQIHSQVIEYCYESNAFIVTALIAMYSKCGSLEDANDVFTEVPLHNIVSWTAMFGAYAQHGHPECALQLHEQMLSEGMHSDKCSLNIILSACSSPSYSADVKRFHVRIISNGFGDDTNLQTSLISMYSKCGSIENAALVYERISTRNVGVCNALLGSYVQHGDAKNAFHLYDWMQRNHIKPDEVTLSTILSACSMLVDLPKGKEIHESVRDAGLESDVIVATSLINMYAKCGSLIDARHVFDNLNGKNAISWNAMIVGYAQNGNAKEAVELFKEMQIAGFRANEVTFTSLLYACSHVGLVEDALYLFHIIDESSEATRRSEHYACIIDMLGRLGRLDEAEGFIKKHSSQADAVMWMSLLGACRVHDDLERAKRATECILQLDGQKTGSYVLLSNIAAASFNKNGVPS